VSPLAAVIKLKRRKTKYRNKEVPFPMAAFRKRTSNRNKEIQFNVFPGTSRPIYVPTFGFKLVLVSVRFHGKNLL
jgi:hypothetical protein